MRIAALLLTFSLFFITAVSLPGAVMAQPVKPPSIEISAGTGFTSLGQALNTILGALFLLGGLLAFAYLLYGAVKYITAGDNSSNTSAARTTMQNAVIGLIILAMVFVIFKFAVNLIPGLGDFFR